MAFNDTLFQLGMDLTRSSTAQKEDLHEVVRLAHEDREDCFAERESARSTPQRIFVDLFGAQRVDSARFVERALKQAFELAKGRVLKTAVSRDQETGSVSGVVTLADGQASIEAWPSTGCVAVDVECYAGMRPELVLTALTEAFDAREAIIRKQRSASDIARMRAVPKRAQLMTATVIPVAKPARARRAA